MDPKTEAAFAKGDAIAGVISLGASVSDTAQAFSSLPYSVCFNMSLENFTNQHLATYQNKITSGNTVSPPVAINPATKESMAGRKSSDTATGCAGTGGIIQKSFYIKMK